MKKEFVEALDEELDNCIKKFRNAVYGEEVRTFISEYEELMMKKSQIVVGEFITEEHGQTVRHGSITGEFLYEGMGEEREHTGIPDTVAEARNQSHQSKYLSVAALITSIAALLICIATALL